MGHVLDDKLSDQQVAFVEYYVTNGFNATKAALAAGYTKASATATGSTLLTYPNVIARVKKRLPDVINPTRIEAEIASIADVNMADFEPLGSGTTLKELQESGVDTRQVKKLTTRTMADGTVRRDVEIHDRHAALEKLAKIHAMFIDRSESTNDTTVHMPDLTGLSDETKAKVIAELGGPTGG